MKPPILFDCAHNPNGAAALFQALEDVFPRIGKTYVFGFMRDKDVAGILTALKPDLEKAFAVTLPGERAMSAAEIAAVGTSVGIDIEPIENPQTAIDWVNAGKKRLLCFTGSLFMAAELKKAGFQI
jgi:dihydrofolate synthase/folylpolyglutamate synthase